MERVGNHAEATSKVVVPRLSSSCTEWRRRIVKPAPKRWLLRPNARKSDSEWGVSPGTNELLNDINALQVRLAAAPRGIADDLIRHCLARRVEAL